MITIKMFLELRNTFFKVCFLLCIFKLFSVVWLFLNLFTQFQQCLCQGTLKGFYYYFFFFLHFLHTVCFISHTLIQCLIQGHFKRLGSISSPILIFEVCLVLAFFFCSLSFFLAIHLPMIFTSCCN